MSGCRCSGGALRRPYQCAANFQPTRPRKPSAHIILVHIEARPASHHHTATDPGPPLQRTPPLPHLRTYVLTYLPTYDYSTILRPEHPSTPSYLAPRQTAVSLNADTDPYFSKYPLLVRTHHGRPQRGRQLPRRRRVLVSDLLPISCLQYLVLGIWDLVLVLCSALLGLRLTYCSPHPASASTQYSTQHITQHEICSCCLEPLFARRTAADATAGLRTTLMDMGGGGTRAVLLSTYSGHLPPALAAGRETD